MAALRAARYALPAVLSTAQRRGTRRAARRDAARHGAAEHGATARHAARPRRSDMNTPDLQVSLLEAEARLASLLRQVAEGRAVTILRQGEPVARLVPSVPPELPPRPKP
jgi:prevent-host-death family protein